MTLFIIIDTSAFECYLAVLFPLFMRGSKYAYETTVLTITKSNIVNKDVAV